MTALVIAMFWAMTVQAQESQDSIESVNKAAIEREQDDARIGSAERENRRAELNGIESLDYFAMLRGWTLCRVDI